MYAHNQQLSPSTETETLSFEELAERAVALLADNRDLTMVCGPIMTGGTGNPTYNFQIVDAVMRGFRREGVAIFDPLPFVDDLRELCDQWWRTTGSTGHCEPLLEVFCRRVLGTGVVSQAVFTPGWTHSYSVCWMRGFLGLPNSGCTIRDLAPEEVQQYLGAVHRRKHVKRIMRRLSSRV